MKISNLSKLISVGALSLSLAVLPHTIPASAQTNSGTSGSTTTTNTADDNSFDWGWLGLLGLFGLAGLAGKKRTEERTEERRLGTTTEERRFDEAPRYRDPNVEPPTGYRE
jgi:LPXTG-motif cell wall-anchored protein